MSAIQEPNVRQSWINREGNLEWTGAGDITPCYYCGVPADSIDHVVPRIILDKGDIIAELVSRHQVLTVPSCRECNSALGADYFDTLKERKESAKQRLRFRYRKILSAPLWTDDEIDEMGDGLSQYLSISMKWKEWMRRRLTW